LCVGYWQLPRPFLGLAAAAIAVFGGAFASVASVEVPPDWVHYILIAVGVLMLASASAASLLIDRGARLITVAMPSESGLIFRVRQADGPLWASESVLLGAGRVAILSASYSPFKHRRRAGIGHG
jgi:hypothetical protein